MATRPEKESLFQSRYWRISMAAVDATAIVFGLWWVKVEAMDWLPKSVFLVLATVVWTGDFAKRAMDQ